MQENYLAKWLNNELSKEELAEFEQTAEYASYKKLVDVSGEMKAPEFAVDKALAELKSKQAKNNTKVVRLRPYAKWMRVAAAIVVILTVSYLYLTGAKDTVSTAYAEHSKVVLPDNTGVFLNAGSKITYDEKKWESNRFIDLEGEAFFKVAKGKRFTVNTDAGTITVLGTQFNVKHRKGFFEVSCFEGLVSVQYSGKDIRLPAGDSFRVVNGKTINGEVEKNTVPTWINNESSFKSMPLAYVMEELERQFNITVATKNVDTQQLFTGTFSNTDLNLALQSIVNPTGIKYTLEGENVLFYAEEAP